MAKLLIKWFQVAVLASSLVITTSAWADDSAAAESNATESEQSAVATETQRPGFLTIVADVIFVRPVTLVATAAGTVLFVATLPITLITGTVGEAGMSMVGDPALSTFARCLGCEEVGWRKLPAKELDDPMERTQ